MSKVTLYNGIKTALLAARWTDSTNATRQFKHVGLWRNDLMREKEGELSYQLPAACIEFLVTEFMESSSQGYQTVRMTARIHYLFESHKPEDLDLLACTQAGYEALQYTQYGYWAKMKRRNEEMSFDHDSVQDFIQDFDCGEGKDFDADQRPTTDADIDTVTVNVTIE